MHMILGFVCFSKDSVCPVGHHMTSEFNSWPMTMENTYAMNNYVSMTRDCIFNEYICVNAMEWNYLTMSKN